MKINVTEKVRGVFAKTPSSPSLALDAVTADEHLSPRPCSPPSSTPQAPPARPRPRPNPLHPLPLQEGTAHASLAAVKPLFPGVSPRESSPPQAKLGQPSAPRHLPVRPGLLEDARTLPITASPDLIRRRRVFEPDLFRRAMATAVNSVHGAPTPWPI